MKITAGSGTSGEEYENMDHRRLAAQGRESCEFYLDPVWEVWSLGPFISHHYKKTLPQKWVCHKNTTLLKTYLFFY